MRDRINKFSNNILVTNGTSFFGLQPFIDAFAVISVAAASELLNFLQSLKLIKAY